MKKKFIFIISIAFLVALLVLYLSLPSILVGSINQKTNGSFKSKSAKISFNSATIEDLSIFDSSGDKAISSKLVKIHFAPLKIITGKNALRTIKSIELDSPQINLKRSYNGEFNLSSLFKSSEKKSSLDLSALSADIKIKNGYFSFKDPSIKLPFKIAVSDIDLTLVPNKDGIYKLELSAVEKAVANNKIKAKGRISLANPFIDINGNISDFKAEQLINSLTEKYGGKYNDGKTEVSFIAKASSSLLSDLLSSLYLKVFYNLQGGNLNLSEYGIAANNLNISADADSNGIQIGKINGTVLGSNFHGKINITNFKSPRLAGSINCKNLDISKILQLNFIKNKLKKNISAEGTISGIVDISGPAIDPQLNCFISAKNTTIEDYFLTHADVSAIVKKNNIEFTDSEIVSSDFNLKLRGWFFPKNTELLLNGNISGKAPALLTNTVLGYSDCIFTVMGTLSDPIVYGSASTNSIEFQKQNIGRTKANFLYDKNTIYVPSAKLSNSSGEINGGAVYDLSSGQILSSVAADNYPIPNISSQFSGNISGNLSVIGTLNSPVAIADMSVNSLNTGDLQFNSLNIPFAVNKDFIKFSANGTDLKGLNVNAVGTASISGTQAMNLDFSVSGIEPSKYDKFKQFAILESPGTLTGSINGNTSMGFIWDTYFSSGKSKISSKGILSNIKKPDILSWGIIDNFSINPPEKSQLSLLQGNISQGQFLITGGLSALDVSGFMNFNKTTVAGIPVTWIYAEAESSKSEINLKKIAIDTGRGSLRLSGKMDPKTKNSKISANASSLDLNYLLSSINFMPYSKFNIKDKLPIDKWDEFQAIADFEGVIDINKGKAGISGILNIPGGVWKNEQLTLLSMFSLDSYGANISNFDLGVGYGKYSGDGKISFTEDMPIDLKVSATNGDLERLTAFLPIPEASIKRGRFDGDLRLAGTLKKPHLEGFIAIKDTFVGGQYVNSVTANISTINGTLTLDNFKVSLPQGNITGNGSISQSGNLDFTFISDDIPCSSITPLNKWLANSEGNMSLCVRVTGTSNNPEFSAEIRTGSLTLMGQRLDDVSSLFSFKNSILTLNELNITRGDELYSLSGSWDINDINDISSAFIGLKHENSHSFKPLKMNASIRNGSLPFLVSLIPSAEKGIYNGSINAELSLSANEKNSRLRAHFILDDGVLMGVPINKFEVDVDRENTFIKNILVDISVPGGSFLMSGEIDGQGEDEVKIESKEFDLAIISPFLHIPNKYALSGKCNLSGSLLGELPIPNISCNFSIDTAQIGEVPIGNIRGNLETEHGSLLKTSIFAVDKGQRIRMNGYIPYAMDDGIFKITDNILIQSRINLKNFNLLSLVLPIEKESSGSIIGKLDINGKFPNMTIDGDLKIKDGNITPNALRNPIKGINADIELKNNNLLLKDVKATMGTGNLTLGGILGFDKTRLSSGDVSIKGNDLQLSTKSMFSGILDVDGKFTVEDGKKYLSGTTNVKNSLITVSPMVLANKKGGTFKDLIPVFLHGTALNLDTSFKNDVWATFLSSQVQAGGDLSITGIAEEPLIKGNIRLSRGSIVVPVVASPFKLYYGSLRFDGTGMIPSVIISGDTKFDDYSAHLSITGQLNDPKIAIDSEIPIGNASSTGNVIDSHMIYSGNSSGYSTDLMNSGTMSDIAFNSMLELSVMRPILNQLGRTFGLTDVSIEFRQNSGMAVRLARALDKNERFLLTYENSTNSQGLLESLWGVEYRFGRGMIIRVANGSLGNNYVWIQARRRF